MRALAPLAAEQAAAGAWLDTTFLLAAIGQIADDHLHRSRSWPKRLAEVLEGGGRAQRSLAAGARAGWATRARGEERRAGYRALARRRDRVVALSAEAAEAALGAVPAAGLAERVADAVGPEWPAPVAGEILTVPSCFRGFDQHPADLVALAAEVAATHPDRSRRLGVWGVRTSGAYLGPLLTAALRAEGYTVRLAGLRPSDHLDAGQRAAARWLGADGLALVVDDPPVSGWSLAEAVDLLVGAGVDRHHVVLALALDGDGLPPALADRPAVLLPGERWHLPGRFTPEAVRDDLAALLGRAVGELTPVAWPGPAAPTVAATARRHHRRAAFRVELDEAPRTLLVESVGQGLFGAHAVAVAERLSRLVPESIGIVDGRHLQWLPVGTGETGSLGVGAAAGVIADHLVARHRALPVAADRLLGEEGRRSVWEVAAQVVSGLLGPADVPLRPGVVGPAVRRLLHVADPSVVDGRIDLGRFLPAPEGAVKLDASEGAFSHRDLATYDPVFDVAALADEPFGPELRRRWEAATGRPVEPERWLLHRLVHQWDRGRHGGSADECARAIGRAVEDWLGEVALADLPSPGPDAPVAALDVDGVLETWVPGASAPGRDGILALRALVAHGHRVVLATGRSAGDVADRLTAWHLPAGVAEYGAVLVDGDTGARTDLRSGPDRERLARVREVLAGTEGVRVDPAYGHVVRAFRRDRQGRRVGLSEDDLARVRAALDDPAAITVVPGESQSDLTPAPCTKATGMAALLGERRPALAVGDGPADHDLLTIAERAFVPAHAAAVAPARAAVTRRPYQAGLAEAVGAVLGHPPGGCPTCHLELDPGNRFLLSVLSVRAAGPAAIPTRLAQVVRAARAVAD